MPPKRKSRGGGAGRGRGGARKNAKKAKKDYSSESEELGLSDTEANGGFDKTDLQRNFKYDFQELMNDPDFNHPEFVHKIDPEDLNVEYFEKSGLEHPLHFRCDPKLIGMKVPDSSFSVNDVLELVGGNRMIEVVEVRNQGGVKMPLEEFITFYKTPAAERKVLYNVLSLEYSLTPLEDLVKSPALVREIDWVGNRWPDALRQRWIAFNGRDKKYYTPHHTFPKVQNYCLMSVADCYTDFHIDFSGTSVWYHVLRGKKVFWLIPPTETNFMLYQHFIQTVNESSFFGKSVESCHMAVLEPGDTMLIPSGWIHAVYTPEDSLVFGGNFLHSLSCKMQIRSYQCENKLNITRKFRLPYNEELIFFVIAEYVKKWTGREYARPLRIEDAKMDYVGQKWIQSGGHLRKIDYSDFENGVELTNDLLDEDEHNESSDSINKEVKVIAMHAENSVFNHHNVQKSAVGESGLEEEADDDKEEDAAKKNADNWDEIVDEMCRTNPLIFYRNTKHDFVRNKSVPDHKLPVGHEPPIDIIQEEIEKISIRLCDELEALGAYLKKKAKVEMAEGISEPASLLNAFLTVLKRRRAQLEGKRVEEVAKKRKYTRHALESGKFQEQPAPNVYSRNASVNSENTENSAELVISEEAGNSNTPKKQEQDDESEEARTNIEDVQESKSVIKKDQNGSAESNSRDNTPEVVRRSSRRAATKASDAIKEEMEDEQKDVENGEANDEEYQEEEEEEGDDLKKEETEEGSETWREKMEKEDKKEPSVGKDSKDKKKLSREEKRELKEREKERKRKSAPLDAALIAAHGMSKSKKKKPEKPQFVGGLPVAPIQNDPVVSNPYNYDPKMEMIKLGTGQLKSAYRKTRNNIELKIEKNLYKLEPKNGNEENGEELEEHEKPTPTNSNEPISIDIFDIPSSSSATTPKNVKKEVKKEREKRGSFSAASPSPRFKESPGVFSPASSSSIGERRKSESMVRKPVYNPPISRQDRMIAEALSPGQVRSKTSSSTERPSNIPGTPQSPHPTKVTKSGSSEIYTPSAPTVQKKFWNSKSLSTERHESIEESPIDVVNDSIISSPRTPSEVFVESPKEIKDSRKISSGSGRRDSRGQEDNGRKSSGTLFSVPKPKVNKIPAREAIEGIKPLLAQLDKLNEAD